MTEATNGLSSSHLSQLEISDSDSDLYEQVDTFEEEEEVDILDEIECYQSKEGKLPEETTSLPHQSSTDVGTSTNGTHFICSDWVSCISIKRLKYLTRIFLLCDILHWVQCAHKATHVRWNKKNMMSVWNKRNL